MNYSLADMERLDKHLANLTSERRVTLRSNCSFEAITQIDGLPRDTVYISNLSKNGLLMIVTPGTFIPEEFQLLGIEEQPTNCRIVWQEGEKFGVEFISEVNKTRTDRVSRL